VCAIVTRVALLRSRWRSSARADDSKGRWVDEKLMKSFDHTEDEYIQHLVSALVHETDSVLESTCAQAVARGDFGAVAEELANDGMMIAQRISALPERLGTC
jgi:hypothetical protein